MYYRNVAFDIYSVLISTSDNISFQTGTTLASGDVTFSIDGSTFANLGTLPSTVPTGTNSRQVKIRVAAGENTGTYGQIIFRDVVGSQWNPVSFAWKNDERVLDSGTAQTGTATTIKLGAWASSTNDLYNYGVIEIIGGTGVGQSRQITGYVGSTKVATIANAWVIIPNNTSIYLIHPGARVPTLAEINTEVDTALMDYDAPTYAELVAEIDALEAMISALDVIPAAAVPDPVINGDITLARGTRWSFSLTGLGIATGTSIVLTVKADEWQTDNDALLQVYNNSNGLIRFAGAAPISAANGEIIVDDATAGDITVEVEVAETVSAPIGDYFYDVKYLSAGGVANIKIAGNFTVTADITRRITP